MAVKMDLARKVRVARAQTGKTQGEIARVLAELYPQLTRASWQSIISYIERGWVDKVLETLVDNDSEY